MATYLDGMKGGKHNSDNAEATFKSKPKYFIAVSPDNIQISGCRRKTYENAEKEIKEWTKRFERQGYYSSNNGRISLDELPKKCRIITNITQLI